MMHETAAPKVIVKRGREGPFVGHHPWLFSGAVARIDGEPADGDEVTVHAHDGAFVARGLYNGRSQIRVRLYSWEEHRALDRAFWKERIEAALRLRRALPGLGRGVAGSDGAARLVFSESDGLSGLTVDRYGPWLAVQVTSLAVAQRRPLLTELLVEACAPRGILLRTEKGVGDLEGLDARDGLIWGEEPVEPVVIDEDGILFEVNIQVGQKTGFYLDQRENRRIAAAFGKGRDALDVCCYTGGFSLALARAGASSVTGVDVSAPAVELARRNALRNGLDNVTFEVDDAFRALERCAAQRGAFGLVVLDPPKFTHSQRAREQALRGYISLNTLALRALAPDGILVTCSCSGRVSREEFAGLLSAAANAAGRRVQVLSSLGQAPDHPVSPSCPETEYLKCFICRAE